MSKRKRGSKSGKKSSLEMVGVVERVGPWLVSMSITFDSAQSGAATNDEILHASVACAMRLCTHIDLLSAATQTDD